MKKATGIPEEFKAFLEEEHHPSSRGRKPAVPAIVVEDLEPARPSGAKESPNLSRADQIVFAYMARGLEMLNAIASCPQLPVSMRQRAAETMVEHGSAIFRGSKVSGKSLPPTPSHFGPESMPSPDASNPLAPHAEAIPEGWGEETIGEPMDGAPESPPDPLPPPPTDLNISHDSQVKKRCEERVLRTIQKYRVCKTSKLKGAVMGDRFGDPPLMDLTLLLQDLVAKGVIAKHNDPSGKASYYLKARPPLPVPPFRVQS